MTVDPEGFEYVVSGDAAEGMNFPVHLGGGTVLQVRTMERGKLIVDFSLNQYVEPGYQGNVTQGNVDVARIDCCHSEVHRHQFYRDNRPQKRYIIKDLKCVSSHKDAENLVSDSYDPCYSTMVDNWELYLERWDDGDAHGGKNN